jgi:hypothetical protein
MAFKKRTTSVVLFIPFGIIASTLYLLGYWGVFHINIFEYVSFSDILIVAIQKIIVIGISLIGGLIVGMTIANGIRAFEKGIDDYLEKQGSKTNVSEVISAKVDKVLSNVLKSILNIALPVYGVYIIVLTAYPGRWLLGGLFFVSIATDAVKAAKILDGMFSRKYETLAIMVFVSILLCSYGWGVLIAQDKKSDKAYVVVNNKAYDKIYLGRAGGEIFFWNNKTETVEVVAARSIDSIKYHIAPEKAYWAFLFDNEPTDKNISTNHRATAE